MKRVPVASTSIATVGYDTASLTLEVEFENGGVYRYFEVPVRVHEAFLSAESKGGFLNTRIKGAYRFERVSRAGDANEASAGEPDGRRWAARRLLR